MKNCLVVVGNGIRNNKLLMDYLYRKVDQHFSQIDAVVYVNKNDSDLFLELEEAVAKFDKIIIASKDGFNLIGKILSTLTEDNLIAKEEMLIPAKTILYSDWSYLLDINEKFINVLMVNERGEIPDILIDGDKKEEFFYVIDMDDVSCRILLEPIAQNYEVKLVLSEVVDGLIYVKAENIKYGQLVSFLEAVQNAFPQKVIADKDFVSFIVNKLIENQKTITCAESCTGGMLSSLLVEKSGVSEVFKGSIVAYSNEVKMALLDVSAQTLEQYGAVSELCIREMLEGALRLVDADIAMAISGVAGPAGGSKEKPVGTIYVGARNREGDILIERLHLKGDRNYIQKQAAFHVLKMVLQVDRDLFF